MNVVTEFASESALCELLYAGNVVLLSETIECRRNKYFKWKEAFESQGLTVHLGKTKVTVRRCITRDALSKNKVDPRVVSISNIEANSVLCHSMVS